MFSAAPTALLSSVCYNRYPLYIINSSRTKIVAVSISVEDNSQVYSFQLKVIKIDIVILQLWYAILSYLCTLTVYVSSYSPPQSSSVTFYAYVVKNSRGNYWGFSLSKLHIVNLHLHKNKAMLITLTTNSKSIIFSYIRFSRLLDNFRSC